MGENVGYSAVHWRVQRSRGKAKNHLCIECNDTADQWAYKYSTGFSENIYDYDPLCISCHNKRDRKPAKTIDFICPMCNKIATTTYRTYKANQLKQGKLGPFCSRSCAGKYGTMIQNGRVLQLDDRGASKASGE